MSITVQQPQPIDLVSDVIRVAGVAGEAFEANYEFEITEGHDSVAGYCVAGDGVGGHGQFQFDVDVSGAAFIAPRVFVHVFHRPPIEGGGREDEVVIPVLLGSQILPGYQVYDEYVVQSGETLWPSPPIDSGQDQTSPYSWPPTRIRSRTLTSSR